MAYQWVDGQRGKKYAEMCEAFIKGGGANPNNLPIINARDHRDEWMAWTAYYQWRGLKWSVDFMVDRNNWIKGKTVPTVTPIEFDAEFNPFYIRKLCKEAGLITDEITPASKARMRFKMGILALAEKTERVRNVKRAQKSGRMEEFIALAQQFGMEVPEEIWEQRDYQWVPETTKVDREIQAALDRYSGRPVIEEGVTYDNWRSGSMKKKWPVGAQWVPILNGRVYGPIDNGTRPI